MGRLYLWAMTSMMCCGVLGHTFLARAQTPAPAAQRANHSGVPDGRALVATAQKFLGVPYVWGGQGQRGFDCSGLIEAVYLRHGYVLPRVSRQQALVGLSAQPPFVPGDLLFFSEAPGSKRITHVAMSMGGTRFIHAALGKGQVTYDHLGERYYAQRLVGARRPLALPPGRYSTRLGLAAAGVAFDSLAQAASFVAAGVVDPNRAAAGQAAQLTPSADMVVEHTGELPQPLARADARIAGATTLDDPFGERHFLPEETGFGLRAGTLISPGEGSMLAGVDARYFGHATGVRADFAFPLALKLKKSHEEVEGDAGRVGSVRQWGRLVRLVQLGQPDAKLFARLSRTDAVTLGWGSLIRHYLPNASSFALGDALLEANAATLLASLSTALFGVSATIDDVFNPGVTGLALRLTPKRDGPFGLHVDWATDWQAPFRDGSGLDITVSRGQVHALSVGSSMRLRDKRGGQLQAYATIGSLIAAVRPAQVAFGGHLGALATFASESSGALGPVFTLRVEGRVHSARYRPSYFSFAYAARRRGMPYVDPQTRLHAEMPALNMLVAQSGQPPEASALAELTAVVAGKLQLGLSYEDGGPTRRRKTGPDFAPRSLTAFAALRGVPLGRSGTRLLHVHALWHTSERKGIWPPVARSAVGTFAEASARGDIFDWLDVGGAIKKPLGPRGRAPGFSLVADASVHFSF